MGPVSYYDLPKNLFLQRIYGDLSWSFFLIHLFQGGKETLWGPNMAITKNMWEKVRSHVCSDETKIHEDFDLAIHILHARGIIKRDDSMMVQTSSRRLITDPVSWFGEYHFRLIKTILHKYRLELFG
jgi:hypothetical protein